MFNVGFSLFIEYLVARVYVSSFIGFLYFFLISHHAYVSNFNNISSVSLSFFSLFFRFQFVYFGAFDTCFCFFSYSFSYTYIFIPFLMLLFSFSNCSFSTLKFCQCILESGDRHVIKTMTNGTGFHMDFIDISYRPEQHRCV